MKKKVVLIYRAPRNAFSIENVFNALVPDLQKKYDVEIRCLPKPGASLKDMVQNIFFVRSIQADIIHVTGDVHYIVLGLLGRKVVLTIHDLGILNDAKNVKKFLLKTLWFQLPVFFCKACTCISQKTKQDLLKITLAKSHSKISIVHDPLPNWFHFSDRPENDIPIIMAFSTTPNKNIPNLIQSVKGLGVHVNILGKLASKDEETLCMYQISYNVYTRLSNEEVLEQYSKADVVYFASTFEGFGLPILEAQAVGRPVITSDLSPMNEIAGEGAVLVNPYYCDDIRRTIGKLLDDKGYYNHVVKSGLENVEGYRASKIALEYNNVYLNVLGLS